MNKTFLLFLACSLSVHFGMAQCAVKTNHRPDGVVVHYMNPEFVGTCKQCDVGLSISTNGEDYFFNLAVRYAQSPEKTIDQLALDLSNDHSLVLPLFNSELTAIDGYDVSISVYYLNETDMTLLLQNSLRKVVFQEEGGRYQVVLVSQNTDLIQKQLSCLQSGQ
jgi:hypothetical protein